MTSFERIGGAPPVSATSLTGGSTDVAGTAKAAMASIGDRVLAWTAQSFATGPGAGARWQAATGAASGFVPDKAELGRRGDVYELRALTSEIGQQFGATPAQEGALGRAIDDFARAVSLRFNALAGGDGGPAVDDVATLLDRATGDGPGGIDGVTSRIETAARSVEALNR